MALRVGFEQGFPGFRSVLVSAHIPFLCIERREFVMRPWSCTWSITQDSLSAVGSHGLRNRPQKGTVRASVAAPALVWAPSIIALLILVIRAARDSVRSR